MFVCVNDVCINLDRIICFRMADDEGDACIVYYYSETAFDQHDFENEKCRNRAFSLILEAIANDVFILEMNSIGEVLDVDC